MEKEEYSWMKEVNKEYNKLKEKALECINDENRKRNEIKLTDIENYSDKEKVQFFNIYISLLKEKINNEQIQSNQAN